MSVMERRAEPAPEAGDTPFDPAAHQPSGHPDLSHGAVSETAARSGAARYGDPSRARRLTGVIAAANAQSARVIGITGSRPGVGVSLTARELAGAFSSFGTKTLLVDLSNARISASEQADGKISFVSSAAEVQRLLFVAEPNGIEPLAASADKLRSALADAAEAGFTVIVDLPPITQASGALEPLIAAAQPALDVAFLICLSGETDQKELVACVETCRIVGLNVGGLILNDWRMPASNLIWKLTRTRAADDPSLLASMREKRARIGET